jgi:hypothetical protein
MRCLRAQGVLTKYKLFVTGLDGKERGLGTPHESEAGALAAYSIAGRTVPATPVAGDDLEDSSPLVVRRPEELPVDALADCLRAHSGEEWGERRRRALAAASAASSKSSEPCREWLEEVVGEDGMVDSFAALHPAARGRFTCWDQYKNRRYSNQARWKTRAGCVRSCARAVKIRPCGLLHSACTCGLLASACTSLSFSPGVAPILWLGSYTPILTPIL